MIGHLETLNGRTIQGSEAIQGLVEWSNLKGVSDLLSGGEVGDAGEGVLNQLEGDAFLAELRG